MRLKGILIGNPCTDPRECFERQAEDSMSIYQYQQLYYHNYLTDKEYTDITGTCTLGYSSEECREIRKKIDKNFDKMMTNINNIYDICYHQTIGESLHKSRAVRSFQTC